MSNYIDPFETDEQTIGRDSRLSRRQSDMDHAEIKARGGFDEALFAKEKFRVPEGFLKIPGASRSGALDPQTRSRYERLEREGEIELQRNAYGEMTGYRPLR